MGTIAPTSVELTQRRALHVLNSLPKIGPITLRRLMDHFGHDAAAILKASSQELKAVPTVGRAMLDPIVRWQEVFDLAREEHKLRQYGGAFVACEDKDYPSLLKTMEDAPIGLNFLGDYRPDKPCIAIVGTRRPTAYGRHVARQLSADLVRCGCCVVSGMARGIDSEAHSGALEAGGKTIAVLGCGPDIIYPPENSALYRRIIKEGAIVSEFPMGRRADRQTFPMRNRIIAGMCAATIVVESGSEGGSMITARFAGEQGRTVFAVPGRIDQATSQGCHALIRDGATLLTRVEEVMEDLNYSRQGTLKLPGIDDKEASPPQSTMGFKALPNDLEVKTRRVAECFEAGEVCSVDGIAVATGLPVNEVTTELMMLELKGIVAKRLDGAFERKG